jgi:hypothetical protein
LCCPFVLDSRPNVSQIQQVVATTAEACCSGVD